MKHKKDGLVYHTSDLLDRFQVVHGWFTRVGGVSKAPYDSLNVKYKIGDKDADVTQNRKLACRALGVNADKLYFANDLAHSNKIYLPELNNKAKDVSGYDAMLLSHPGQVAALSVADCIPLFLADINKQVVMVVHVGWRGLLEGIVEHSINAMAYEGVRFGDILAAIGPSNRVETYEFSHQDLEPIQRVFSGNQIIREKSNKWYVDVVKGCKLKLQGCGVSKIDDCGINNSLNLKEFYSYRAERPQTGRFGAFIAM